MKYLVLFLINLYQDILSVLIKNVLGIKSSCRFHPTCSEYAKITIVKEGVLKGSLSSLRRVLRCQPFYKNQYGRNI